MAKTPKQSLVQQLARRQREEITIAVESIPTEDIQAEARHRGWKLLPLRLCSGKIPSDIHCQGGLLESTRALGWEGEFQMHGCKIVRITLTPNAKINEFTTVLPDHFAYGVKAAEHFYERGFKDVGYIGWQPWGNMKPLFDGLRERAESLGMICHLKLMKLKEETPAARYKRHQRELSGWVRGQTAPMGILAYSDLAAAQWCFMLAQSGINVPTDVAILALGNAPHICENTFPPLSYFARYYKSLVQAAFHRLELMLKGEPPPQNPVWVPPQEILERQSTYVLATPNRIVARALRFVWDHFNEPLTVEDVAEVVAVSRSKLDRVFRENFPRSIKAELNRKRLEKCQQLLRETTMDMAQIASSTGLKSREYMWQVFNREFGLSPRQYREKYQP